MTRDDNDAILDIIQALRSTNSKMEKQVILAENKGFDAWYDYLLAVYNPFRTYGRSGDKDGDQDNLENLKLCRSLNAGISEVTINKVYDNLIPTASKMNKAYDYGKKPKPLSFPLWAGIKYDGNYVNIVVTDEGEKFYTSGGHEYSHPGHGMDLLEGFVYMAERIYGEGKLGDRRRCSLEGPKGAKVAKSDNHYKIFDCVTLSDFNTGQSVVGYEARRSFIPLKYRGEERHVDCMEELEAFLKEVVDAKLEGLVMKDPDWKWKDTKSRRITFAKWKKIPTADLICVDEIEGTGNAKGYLGSIRLRDSLDRHVNVGSGLTRDISYPCGNYVGRVVEISYEHINPSGTYIQPRVEGLREDKTIDDID